MATHKVKKQKKRNPQDLTLRNSRATVRAIIGLQLKVAMITKRLTNLENDVEDNYRAVFPDVN